jgi:alanine racemase
VSAIPGVALDDPVVLLGRQGADAISAEGLARMAETINYEIVTSLLPRLPRVYVNR